MSELKTFIPIFLKVGFGTPHFGQVFASVETLTPHSLHDFKAINFSYDFKYNL